MSTRAQIVIGSEVLVAQEFLDDADVLARLQQMGGEGVAEGVAPSVFGDTRPANGLLH
jgi:hypothetical protein